MSRSYRHTPIFGGGHSAKWWKKYIHGMERARSKNHLVHERWEKAEVEQVHRGQVGWDGPKEGRGYESPWDKEWCRCCYYSHQPYINAFDPDSPNFRKKQRKCKTAFYECWMHKRYGSLENYIKKNMRK